MFFIRGTVPGPESPQVLRGIISDLNYMHGSHFVRKHARRKLSTIPLQVAKNALRGATKSRGNLILSTSVMVTAVPF